MPLVKRKPADADEELTKQIDTAIAMANVGKEPTDPRDKRISRAGLIQAAGQAVASLNVSQYVETPTLDAVMAELKSRTRELALDWLQFIND